MSLMDMSKKQLMVWVAGIVLSNATLATEISKDEYEAIDKRTRPIGNVYLAGAEPVIEVASGPRDGAKVYGTFCIACHGSGVNGAPIKGDAAAWAPRIAQGKDVLAKHAINGFNAMPAKGTCMDCSDDEIVAAINHMIEGL